MIGRLQISLLIDFHVVNTWGRQSDAAVRLEHHGLLNGILFFHLLSFTSLNCIVIFSHIFNWWQINTYMRTLSFCRLLKFPFSSYVYQLYHECKAKRASPENLQMLKLLILKLRCYAALKLENLCRCSTKLIYFCKTLPLALDCRQNRQSKYSL